MIDDITCSVPLATLSLGIPQEGSYRDFLVVREILYKGCPCTVDSAEYTFDCTLSTVDYPFVEPHVECTVDYPCVEPHVVCTVDFSAYSVDCDLCNVDCYHTVDCLCTVDWHYNFPDNSADTVYLTGTGLVLNIHAVNIHSVNLHNLNILVVKPPAEDTHSLNIH